jgi:hypothetical protein
MEREPPCVPMPITSPATNFITLTASGSIIFRRSLRYIKINDDNHVSLLFEIHTFFGKK